MSLRPRIASLTPRERPAIDRKPSPTLARVTPWLSVLASSVAATVLWIASAPLLPPFGLLMLIGWRQMRPGLLPVWAALPLGLFDDLVSGQPLGSAVLLWSLVTLALDAIEQGIPGRNRFLDWLIASALIAAAIVLGAVIANIIGGDTPLRFTAPQIGLSVLCYPMMARIVAALDRFRLLPFVRVSAWS